MSQIYDEDTVVEYLVLKLVEDPAVLDSVSPSLRRRIGDAFMNIIRKRRTVGQGNPNQAQIHAINGVTSPWEQPMRGERDGYQDLSHLIL